MEFTLACDLMMDLDGPIRPAVYLAYELVKRGHNVSILSPTIASDVQERLGISGIRPVNLHATLTARNSGLSLLWLETWAREAFLKLNSKHVSSDSLVTINFSHTLAIPSLFWYVQGPTSIALRDIASELTLTYRFGYEILKPFIEYADGRLVRDISSKSTFLVANSKFCASMYRKWGIEVKEIIYPPIDCKIFQPHTSSPSSNYVLTYFGKETKFSLVKTLADSGISIKAFGSKAPFVPKSLIVHPKIEFLGRVTTDELVDAYSNALFTLFSFTHEPFGYIPIESMACGTPTLTYDMQGPGESIVNERLGWLAKDDEELVYKALKLWKNGYPLGIRSNCVKTALIFDKKAYVEKWLKTMNEREQLLETNPSGPCPSTSRSQCQTI
jgi:glycosyltransferase involved in cell wall biosynthesis